MITPTTSAAVPTAATSQPAATNPQNNAAWQQFYDWFAYGILPGSSSGSSSTPAAATDQPAAQATTPKPPASQPSQPASPAPDPLFEANVTGTGPFGGTSIYNSTQFATAETAQKMADLVGGKEQDFTLGLYTTSAPIREIVGAGANPLNAGLVADLFQKYGDAPNSYAWQVIDRDLGKIQG